MRAKFVSVVGEIDTLPGCSQLGFLMVFTSLLTYVDKGLVNWQMS
jgi:hypothetical protein